VVKPQKEILISHHNPEYNFLKNYNLKELFKDGKFKNKT